MELRAALAAARGTGGVSHPPRHSSAELPPQSGSLFHVPNYVLPSRSNDKLRVAERAWVALQVCMAAHAQPAITPLRGSVHEPALKLSEAVIHAFPQYHLMYAYPKGRISCNTVCHASEKACFCQRLSHA